jgi:predicted MPP superfamily phosphohydrolase
VLIGLVGLLGASLILHPITERVGPRWLARLVAWPASCWMGVAFLLLLSSWGLDLLGVLLAVSVDADIASSVVAARFKAVAALGLVLPASAVAIRNAMSKPMVKQVEIGLRRWPAALDGFRIVQISDIHFGPILGESFARWLTNRVNALEPDLIAVTGDLVDGPVRHLADEVLPLAELRARHGVFFVTGNHDHYSGADSWADQVASLGMRLLRNTSQRLEVAGETFEVVGVDDHRSRQFPGDGGEDLDAALAHVDPQRPTLLLAHDPTTFKQASRRGIDLQLSGHTHGGQIWPFMYFVRLAVPFVAGLYERSGAKLYVSRGTGFWGPPMRLGAPAEITEIVLRRAAD